VLRYFRLFNHSRQLAVYFFVTLNVFSVHRCTSGSSVKSLHVIRKSDLLSAILFLHAGGFTDLPNSSRGSLVNWRWLNRILVSEFSPLFTFLWLHLKLWVMNNGGIYCLIFLARTFNQKCRNYFTKKPINIIINSLFNITWPWANTITGPNLFIQILCT